MPGGRPSKLTLEVQEKVITAIRAGNYIETASAFAGVSKPTLYEWLKRGAEVGKGIYYEFSQAVEQALAASEVRDVMIIAKAAEENWQASAWRLERKFPERWGRKDKIQHGGALEVTNRHEQDITLNIIHDTESLELAEQLLRRAAGRDPGSLRVDG